MIKPKEEIVEKFPHRCPYCDQPISYDPFDLKVGENEVQCPSCKKIYIKIFSGSLEKPLRERKKRRRK
jgi:uncharacterized Zn-finger protein